MSCYIFLLPIKVKLLRIRNMDYKPFIMTLDRQYLYPKMTWLRGAGKVFWCSGFSEACGDVTVFTAFRFDYHYGVISFIN